MIVSNDFPLISLIVPVYNVENYISECLISIKRQTYPNIEIVIVIDGATDGSCRIAREISKGDKRFIIHEQANKGVGAARNTGIALAHGKFVLFIDPDDWIVPDYVETLFGGQLNNDASLVICGYNKIFVRQNGRCKKYPVSPVSAVYNGIAEARQKYLELLEANLIASPWGKLYKMEIIKKNNVCFPSYHRMQDIVFNCRYYNHISNVKVIPYIGYNYRVEYEKRLRRTSSKNSQTLIILIYDEMRMFLEMKWKLGKDRRLETYLLNYVIAGVERNRLFHIEQKELLHNRNLQKIVRASRPHSSIKKIFRFLFIRKKAYWIDVMTGAKIKIKKLLIAVLCNE